MNRAVRELARLVVLGSTSIGCNSSATPPEQSHTAVVLWSKSFGGLDDQAVRSAAADASGEILIGGYMHGTISFGGRTLTSAFDANAFVAEFDGSGTYRGSKQFHGTGAQVTRGVAIDASGGRFLCGYFYGSIDLGGGPLVSAGGEDAFVARLDEHGNHVWSARFGGPSNDRAEDVQLSPAGVVVAGIFAGSIPLGGATVQGASDGAPDLFVVQLDDAGQHVWSKTLVGPGEQHVRRIAVDPAGDVVMAGSLIGSMELDGRQLKSAGDADVFVAKLDSRGEPLWSARFGDAAAQEARGVAIDAGGNILVSGLVDGTVDFGGGPQRSSGDDDAFVLKLDGSGKHAWSKTLGGPGIQIGEAVSVDASGDVVLAVDFAGTIVVDERSIVSAGMDDILLVKLSADGRVSWARSFGDAAEQHAELVTPGADGSTLLCGSFGGIVDFGTGPLVSAGGLDGYLVKLND